MTIFTSFASPGTVSVARFRAFRLAIGDVGLANLCSAKDGYNDFTLSTVCTE